jgi:YfiH family protein
MNSDNRHAADSPSPSPPASGPDPRPLTLADCLVPDWPVAPRVRALFTTRRGGVSVGPFGLREGTLDQPGGLNLGLRSGDEITAVLRNRERLRRLCAADIAWLEQQHGSHVVDARAALATGNAPLGPVDSASAWPPGCAADASVSNAPGVVCAVLAADCMPILLCDKAGTAVGAVHAGWRGLAAGVVEAAAARVIELAGPGSELHAFLGPAIGPHEFEVGADVVEAFTDAASAAELPATAAAFCPRDGVPGKYWADLFALARLRLERAGAVDVRGGDWFTVADPQRFYSYRRDGVTGRTAGLVWLAGGATPRAEA